MTMARARIFMPPMSFARIIAVAIICVSISACQTVGRTGLVASADRAELSPAAANSIADDMVDKLAGTVGPGTGTIVVKPDGSAFGKALQASLKSKGYAVATADQKADGIGKPIPLAFVVDSFKGSVLARLSTTSVDLGRAYTVTAAGASPSSPLSVKHRG